MSKELKRPARMTLELPPRARGKLERLSQETDQSLSEVIRRALALYDLLGAEATAGNKLIIRSRDGEREIIIAEFEAKESQVPNSRFEPPPGGEDRLLRRGHGIADRVALCHPVFGLRPSAAAVPAIADGSTSTSSSART